MDDPDFTREELERHGADDAVAKDIVWRLARFALRLLDERDGDLPGPCADANAMVVQLIRERDAERAARKLDVEAFRQIDVEASVSDTVTPRPRPCAISRHAIDAARARLDAWDREQAETANTPRVEGDPGSAP